MTSELAQESAYLGTERVGRLLRKFSIPCICSLLISCLYNIVDQIFVGNKVGPLGNAATGIIFPITVIGWGASLLFGDGAAALMSISLGRKETSRLHRIAGSSVLCSFLSGVVIITIGYIGGDSLLRLIGATDDGLLSLAHEYGFIIYAMMPLALAQNTLAAIIRADGSPRYAMFAMLAGAVFNIIGDPIAIYALDLGIRGAAYATILGQFLSFVICALYLLRSKNFRVRISSFLPDFSTLGRVVALGMSSFLTQLSIVIVTMVNNILLVKYGVQSIYGTEIPLGSFVVIMKLFQIILNVAIGIAAGAQPIVGYNYGTQQLDRVRALLRLVLLWTGGICLFFNLLFVLLPNPFILMFGSNGGDELYLEFAVRCLQIYLCLLVFTCLQKVCAIFLQSIGHTKSAVPLSFLRDALLLIFSLLFPLGAGVTGIFWAAPAADLLAMAVTALVMLRIWKQLSRKQA